MKIIKIPSRRPDTIIRKKVAAYARVSTASDAQLHSLGAQIDFYKKQIMSRPDWEFAGVFIDDGVTGTKSKREGLDELLTACRDGKIDLIITKSISRFARNTVNLLNIVRDLKESKIAVYFEREKINTLNAEGELLLTLLASFAQEESRSASNNMKWSIRKGYAEGSLKQVRRCYGYLVELGEVTIVPEEAKVVKEVFERYELGELPSSIAKDLNRRKIYTLQGAKWSVNRLNVLTANIFYTGNTLLQKLFVPNHLDKKQIKNRGELPQYFIENSHEPIISMELFEAVREVKAKRTYKKRPDTKHAFSGKLICGVCGANLNRKYDRGNHKWQCRTYRKSGVAACPSKQVPENTLEVSAAEALGLPSFDEMNFLEKIDEVIVHNGNKLIFRFKDGSKKDIYWEDRSRSESWTKEMRAAAGRKTKERYGN